jgi:hypothetical protein
VADYFAKSVPYDSDQGSLINGKSMNELTYSEKLRLPAWQKKRLKILERDRWTCLCCLDQNTNLQVHHEHYKGFANPEDAPDNTLGTLCEHCHWAITWLGKNLKSADDFEMIKLDQNKIGIAYADKSIYVFDLVKKALLVELNPLNSKTVQFFLNSWNKSESSI